MNNKSYLRIQEEKILKEVELLQSVPHPTTKGNHLEGLLLQFLKEELPKRYSVNSGFIIGVRGWENFAQYEDGKDGKFRSKEVDVVIFDEQRNVNPLKLFNKRDFYVEAVHAVISIKSSLDKKTFLDIEECGMLPNLISAKGIKKHSISHPIIGRRRTSDSKNIFATDPIFAVGFTYMAKVSLATIKKYLDVESKKYSWWYDIFPDMIVVLGKGIIYLDQNVDESQFEYKILETPDNTLEEFFIHLLAALNNGQHFVTGLTAYKNFYDDIPKSVLEAVAEKYSKKGVKN